MFDRIVFRGPRKVLLRTVRKQAPPSGNVLLSAHTSLNRPTTVNQFAARLSSLFFSLSFDLSNTAILTFVVGAYI